MTNQKFIRALLWRLVVVAGLAAPVAAGAFWLSGRTGVPWHVPANQSFQGDYVKLGETIDLAGEIDGDVIVAGARVTIGGTVTGDVIAAAAAELVITGDVEGDVRVAGRAVTISGAVGKNLNVWGVRVAVAPTASVGRNAYVSGETIDLAGIISGSVASRGVTQRLAGTVTKTAAFELGDQGRLTLTPEAKVGGDFTYLAGSPEQVRGNLTGQVGGEVMHQPLPSPAERLRQHLFGRLVSLFGLLVVGLVLVSLVPRYCLRVADQMGGRQGWLTLAWGFVGVLVMPLFAFALLFTMIGIPLALMLLAVYLVVLYLAQVVAGVTVGILLFQRFFGGRLAKTLLPPMVVGMTVLVLVSSLGPVGWLVRLAAVLWGTGAILKLKVEQFKEWR